MGNAVPSQHPAVVLRSHYQHLRALLAIAMIAVVGLSTAVVVLAVDDGTDSGARSATPVSAPAPNGGSRYDGGPEEGTRGIQPSSTSTRYDGGPEEGSRGIGR